ncbi:hypothetical protein DN757_24315 [Paenibacillus silvae]|uniref:Uncharacterized protein n=1 Tax=Paenibacillus silvae TaxID=1325358 RepID=A0A2W6NAR7_9BACL|nr:hypothetical protein DN757_24315 [Paenibacillus silvae]
MMSLDFGGIENKLGNDFDYFAWWLVDGGGNDLFTPVFGSLVIQTIHLLQMCKPVCLFNWAGVMVAYIGWNKLHVGFEWF